MPVSAISARSASSSVASRGSIDAALSLRTSIVRILHIETVVTTPGFSTVSDMEASRRQPGMLQGLSRFLVQHERCGAGFDVAHPAGLGSGRVSITCRGCGARHEYATATIEVERELTIEPAQPPASQQRPPRRSPPPIPPRPAPYPDSAERPAAAGPARERTAAQAGAAQGSGARTGAGAGALPSAGARRSAGAAVSAGAGTPGTQPRTAAPPRQPGAMEALRRFWRSPRATLALLIVAAAALGFGVVRLVNGGGSDNQVTQPAAPPPATSISPPATTPVPTSPIGGPEPAPAKLSTTTLRTERFTLQVPKGWTERTSTGGLLLEPREGGRVNVQVFFQRSPGLGLSRMADQTSHFLRHEVPGASLFPNKIRIGGRPAYEITARGPGETAIAVDILRDPYRYLVVRRIFAGAKPDTSQAAGRIVSSFKPR
jgi:hypothetical protein